jgi:hypothetical protein
MRVTFEARVRVRRRVNARTSGPTPVPHARSSSSSSELPRRARQSAKRLPRLPRLAQPCGQAQRPPACRADVHGVTQGWSCACTRRPSPGGPGTPAHGEPRLSQPAGDLSLISCAMAGSRRYVMTGVTGCDVRTVMTRLQCHDRMCHARGSRAWAVRPIENRCGLS